MASSSRGEVWRLPQRVRRDARILRPHKDIKPDRAAFGATSIFLRRLRVDQSGRAISSNGKGDTTLKVSFKSLWPRLRPRGDICDSRSVRGTEVFPALSRNRVFRRVIYSMICSHSKMRIVAGPDGRSAGMTPLSAQSSTPARRQQPRHRRRGRGRESSQVTPRLGDEKD